MQLSNIVDYATDSIVSRELLKSAHGGITLFSFDAGQRLSEHTAPFDAMAQVLEGEARITIDGTPVEVRAGEALLLPAHHPHALWAERRFKMLLTMIHA